MKAKDLLSQLSDMEQSLHEFSFEELTATEAAALKKAFEVFRQRLETRIFQPVAPAQESNVLPEETESAPTRTGSSDPNMLIARVSHEIRTPLNGIIGFTDLLKEDEGLNAAQLDQVNAIQKASFSLMDIINELLEYSKLASGQETFESIHFNFKNLIGDVVYLCKTLIAEKNVTIQVELDEHIPNALLGDPSKLTQVLLNLVGNAIKFVEQGKIDIAVRAGKQNEDTVELTFTIADTGIGISEENLKHIFDSFRQAEANTHVKYGGSGLGLSIVKRIIELLGGEIQVHSEVGVGTTFEFTMPFQLGDTTQIFAAEKDQHSAQEKERVKGMRILIFEDNSLNQRLIEQRLKSWKCKPFITDNAQYGLHILSTHQIDLIFMDLKMPGMNGFEITKLIRGFEKPGSPSIPIVALSADFSKCDKEACLESGMDGFILKPFTPEELLHTLLEYQNEGDYTFSIRPRPNSAEVPKTQTSKVDLSELLEECMGELELVEELVGLYKSNALQFIGMLRVHLQEEDIEQIAFAAHKIKAGLKMVPSNGLVALVEQMQESCEGESDMQALRSLYDRFIVEYPRVEQELDRALNELKEER